MSRGASVCLVHTRLCFPFVQHAYKCYTALRAPVPELSSLPKVITPRQNSPQMSPLSAIVRPGPRPPNSSLGDEARAPLPATPLPQPSIRSVTPQAPIALHSSMRLLLSSSSHQERRLVGFVNYIRSGGSPASSITSRAAARRLRQRPNHRAGRGAAVA